MLIKRMFLTLGLIGLMTLAAGGQEAKPAPRAIKIKLNYTGAGTVDEKHKIFVFLFDSPDFMKGTGEVMPVGSESADTKDATVTISGIPSPVYAVAAYDPAGGYDGQTGPPPAGSSLGMYTKTPGTPEPVKIEPGQTASVDLAFDDTAKMK